MTRAIALSIALLASACATPPPPAQSEPKPAVVAVEAPPDDAPPPAVTTVEDVPPSVSDLTACAAKIRDAAGLPASTEERALYAAALDAERAGDLTTARKSYLELVQKMPRSRFVPLTYLAFGELFRMETESDPNKAPIAAQAYREVLKFPPPENTAFAYAALQMARVERDGEPQKALADFKRAIEGAATSPCPEAISEHARRGMAQTYVTVGRPERAWQFFRRVAADDAAAAEMLASLFDEYQSVGKTDEGCIAARAAGSAALAASPRLAARADACKSRR